MEVEEPVPGTAERILLGKQTPEDEDEEGGCGGCAGGGGGRVKGEWTLTSWSDLQSSGKMDTQWGFCFFNHRKTD